jgi:hypothetical protein
LEDTLVDEREIRLFDFKFLGGKMLAFEGVNVDGGVGERRLGSPRSSGFTRRGFEIDGGI